ncbi:hypothetical protein BH10PLA1_BH10PLA1_00890 [soil metagenome]
MDTKSENFNSEINNPDNSNESDHNPDAITGTAGSHPVGTGMGAAALGAAGAVIGSVAPGAGTALGGAIGAAIGAMVGGLAGKGIAEALDPSTENAYWRNEYRNRKYYDSSLDYDADFAPAYRYGWESYNLYANRPADEVEDSLRAGWEKNCGTSRLKWDRAQHAVHDAWDRLNARSINAARDVTGGHNTEPFNRTHPDRPVNTAPGRGAVAAQDLIDPFDKRQPNDRNRL